MNKFYVYICGFFHRWCKCGDEAPCTCGTLALELFLLTVAARMQFGAPTYKVRMVWHKRKFDKDSGVPAEEVPAASNRTDICVLNASGEEVVNSYVTTMYRTGEYVRADWVGRPWVEKIRRRCSARAVVLVEGSDYDLAAYRYCLTRVARRWTMTGVDPFVRGVDLRQPAAQ